jgi:hypothetical protein
VTERVERVVQTSAAGTVRYHVDVLPFDVASASAPVTDGVLKLALKSTGTWQSNQAPAEAVTRQVDVVVELRPRVPAVLANSGSANDVAANPGDFDTIQQYALFAEKGYDSLTCDPRALIDGNVWLYENLRLYRGLTWPGNARSDVLGSIGRRFARFDGIYHPHPLAGTVTFCRAPTLEVLIDLARLGVPVAWKPTPQLKSPVTDYSAWRKYRLFAGGFEYSAVNIESKLRGITLRPTASNPLGVFYREGSVELEDNVTIQGTLVATDRVSLVGDRIHVTSFNWRGGSGSGSGIVSEAERWPRLPAIVAKEVQLERNVQAAIEGAVVADRSVYGAGGSFKYMGTLEDEVHITGTATARPIGQPWSVVQLQEDRDLSRVTAERHAVWLAGGKSGAWHTITNVDAAAKQLTVRGEVRHESATAYVIRRNRRQFLDIRGPVAAETYRIDATPPWRLVTTAQWAEIRNRWKQDGGECVDWLANPAKFAAMGWGEPYSEYGLGLEPTFHVRHSPADVNFRWSPPLFQAFSGTATDTAEAGYRWEVVSWRELP